MSKVKKLVDAMAGQKPVVMTGYQINLASKYFAISNLGLDRLLGKKVTCAADIQRAYQMADQACAEGSGDMEGPGAEPERKSFEKDLRSKAKKAYWIGELQKEIPWLFSVESPKFF